MVIPEMVLEGHERTSEVTGGKYSGIFLRIYVVNSSSLFLVFWLVLSLPRVGNYNYNNGNLNNRGSNGNYWSGVANSATNGRNLNFNSGNLNPQNNNNKGNGFSVRCVAR